MLGRNFRGECVLSIHTSIFALALAAASLGCSDSTPDSQGPANPGAPTGGTSNPGAGGSNATTGGTPGAGASATTGGTTPGTGGSSTTGGTPATGGTGGTGLNPNPALGDIVPLFDASTELEPAVVIDMPDKLVTRWADRARDRHARENQFKSYEHYLHIYWEHRTAQVEIVDTVGKGGDSVTFNVITEWKLDDGQAELRFFFRGIGTVAEYNNNGVMKPVANPQGIVDNLHYTRTVTQYQGLDGGGRPLQVGDKMEFELSQFLDKNFDGEALVGRDNYYGTTMLYVVGKGLVPWIGSGTRRDSEMVPEEAWLGGHTTVHVNESDEPDNMFMQMAANLAPQNGQKFVLGRRAIHTDFQNGQHDESAENPFWLEQAGKRGPLSINKSCNQCHFQNGRAVPPATGTPLDKFVFKVGQEDGSDDPALGHVLQPTGGEPSVSIASWTEEAGLRKPVFAFTGGAAPTHFSPRVAPPLVGLGLLEAIDELDIIALEDENDRNGDGISGRLSKVTDPVSGVTRLGRFGWKAGQASVVQQVAAALRTDMGVLTSIYPTPDCGSAQTNCGASQPEFGDLELNNLGIYVSLLGMRPQRDWAKPEVIQGRQVFMETGCASCHTPSFTTSEYALHAELRSQKIQPFTDLLLHDMGPGLADTLPEGGASYSEWRTPPLWSIGLTAGVSGEESYLHDGRARTLTEAILWHGGEGQASKDKFAALPEGEKAALLAFLKSL